MRSRCHQRPSQQARIRDRKSTGRHQASKQDKEQVERQVKRKESRQEALALSHTPREVSVNHVLLSVLLWHCWAITCVPVFDLCPPRVGCKHVPFALSASSACCQELPDLPQHVHTRITVKERQNPHDERLSWTEERRVMHNPTTYRNVWLLK